MDQIVLKKFNEIIFYYIHEAPRLRRLFIRWSYLELSDRKNIDEIMQMCLQEKQNELYISLRDALEAWEHLQDTQGAPGFQSGRIQCACAEGIENDLRCIMILFENCLDKIYEQKTNQSKRPYTAITDNVTDNHDPCILLFNDISNLAKLIFSTNFKKSTITDSKSDSRISRRSVPIKNGSGEGALLTIQSDDMDRYRRARSTSVNGCNNYNLKDLQQKKINTNWIKFSPTNGYRSE